MRITKVELSARRNPEQNQKINSYQALLPYSKRDDIYISFTNVDKIGVNPKSTFNTPLGIYCYPLKEAWINYKIGYNQSLDGIPYAADRPYIWILEVKDKNSFIEDMYSCYGSNKFDKDQVVLLNIFIEYKMNLFEKGLNRVIHSKENLEQMEADYKNDIADEWEKLFENSLATAKEKNPVMSFWNLTRNLAILLTKQKDVVVTATKWNWLLRQCGYSGFADKRGRGYIHPSEPCQAVFLSKDAFKVIDKVLNKEYKKFEYNIKIHIKDMNDVIDFVQSDKKNWESNILNTEYVFNCIAGIDSAAETKYTAQLCSPLEMWKKCNPEQLDDLIRLLVKFEKYIGHEAFIGLVKEFNFRFKKFSDKNYWPEYML